jgi:hypothetical protein
MGFFSAQVLPVGSAVLLSQQQDAGPLNDTDDFQLAGQQGHQLHLRIQRGNAHELLFRKALAAAQVEIGKGNPGPGEQGQGKVPTKLHRASGRLDHGFFDLRLVVVEIHEKGNCHQGSHHQHRQHPEHQSSPLDHFHRLSPP